MVAKKGAGKTIYGQQKPLPLLTVISPAIIASAITHKCCLAFSLDSLSGVVRKSAPRSLSITPSRVAYACSAKIFSLEMGVAGSKPTENTSQATSRLRSSGLDTQTGYGAANTLLMASGDRDVEEIKCADADADADAEKYKGVYLEADSVARAILETEEMRQAGTLMTEGQDSSDATSGDGSNRRLIIEILKLALPALVSLCVDPLMSAVDTAYIGRLGPDLGGSEVGLGALGLNTYVFSFVFYVFNFLATVPTPFVASARAKGDNVGAAKLVGQLLTFAIALGMVLTFLLECFAPTVLHIMGATPVNEAEALLFLRARALSAPAVLLMTVGNGAYRGFLDTKTPLLIGVAANALNFALDPLLIFKLGMGVQGAAIATVTAEWTGALAFLFLLGRKDPTIRPRMINLPRSREGWEQGRSVATSSAAVFGRSMALQAVLTMASAFAARAGPASIAAHQVASQLWLLLAYAADSLAVAAQGLIADRMGAGVLLEARKVAMLTLLLSAGWGFGVTVIFQVAKGVLPLIFTTDKQVLAALAPIIVVVGLMQPINTYIFAGDGILQGSKDFVYEAFTMAMSASIGAGYIISCGYLGNGITLLDVWIGLVLMQGSRAVTFSYRHWLDPRGPLALPREPEEST